MPVYRLWCELIVEAPDAAQAADRVRDALCEIDGEVDCVTHVELSEPPRVLAPEVADEEAA